MTNEKPNSSTAAISRNPSQIGRFYVEKASQKTSNSDFMNAENRQFEAIKYDTIRSNSNDKTMERLPSVIKRTGLSRSSIYNLLNPHHPSYDPSFPEQIQLSQKIVAWDSAEITAWLESKISAHKERKQRDDF